MLRPLAVVVMVLLFLSGAALVGYARWTRPIAAADTALAEGRLQDAVAGYVQGEARFDGLPAARQLFAAEYARAYANHLSALYAGKNYDAVIDLAEKAPAEAGPHFWSGCAFFEKAAVEEKPDARLGWLTRAEDEFRKAIERTPSDWDTKYDFELTTRLAAELRKQPKTPPKQLMQLLRPPQSATKQPRRVG